MSYGIPISVLPIDHCGNVRYDLIAQCIQKLRKRETEQKKLLSMSFGSQQSKTITAATDKDVLLGRGVPIQSHPGNLRLAELIDIHYEEFYHLKTSRARKTAITWSIVHAIQNKVGGRFLEKDVSTGMWKVADDDSARNKVAICFRSKLKMDKQRRQRQREQHNDNAETSNYLFTKEDEAIFDKLFPDSNDIPPELGEADGLGENFDWCAPLDDVAESNELSRRPVVIGRIINKRQKVAS